MAEYAVVDAFIVAAETYRAILKVCPVDAVKLCVAVRSSVLNELQIACVIAKSVSCRIHPMFRFRALHCFLNIV